MISTVADADKLKFIILEKILVNKKYIQVLLTKDLIFMSFHTRGIECLEIKLYMEVISQYKDFVIEKIIQGSRLSECKLFFMCLLRT